jgi:hypothetical protein
MVLITKLLGLINQLITGGPHIVVKVSPRFVASCHRRVMTMVEKKHGNWKPIRNYPKVVAHLKIHEVQRL